jgi:quinone-modifying oxidoreductase, subunit QmoC
MAEQLISTDMKFIQEVLASGGGDLMKCYQCGTCSVVCNPTPEEKPFPRKEMLYAQWGMRDKLMSDPDLWLCHQCSDCTAHCPRGAKPGEVIGALRKLAVATYSPPLLLGKMTGNKRYLLILFAVPVVILLAILAFLGNLTISGIPRGAFGEIIYSKFMPVLAIDVVFSAAALFAVFSLSIGVYRYWKVLKSGIDASQWAETGAVWKSIARAMGDILPHREFRKCDYARGRSNAHLLTFYGFIGLAITTTWAMYYLYALKWESPYPLNDPLKIWANFSALAFVTGITLVIVTRFRTAPKAGFGNYFDWLLIMVLYTIAATGILAEILRLLNIASFAYPVYFIHLVFVFFLFAYAPFSKMAHLVYRVVAMVFKKHVGDDLRPAGMALK